jgi:hypothetical protein
MRVAHHGGHISHPEKFFRAIFPLTGLFNKQSGSDLGRDAS